MKATKEQKKRWVLSVLIIIFFVVLGFAASKIYNQNSDIIDPQNPELFQNALQEDLVTLPF